MLKDILKTFPEAQILSKQLPETCSYFARMYPTESYVFQNGSTILIPGVEDLKI